MRCSEKGIALIKEFEGCILTAYPDPATGGDPWTIGVGHTGPEVKAGLIITEAQADDYLRADLETAEKCINNLVTQILTQEQFDALCSFVFNLGCGALRSSTLLRKLNTGDDVGAADEFLKWNKAAGKIMAGLTRRREAEKELFLA
jgi:lysozyme